MASRENDPNLYSLCGFNDLTAILDFFWKHFRCDLLMESGEGDITPSNLCWASLNRGLIKLNDNFQDQPITIAAFVW